MSTILKASATKRVDIKARKLITNLGKIPLRMGGFIPNQLVTVGQIRTLLPNADVHEILPNGKKLLLTMENYNLINYGAEDNDKTVIAAKIAAEEEAKRLAEVAEQEAAAEAKLLADEKAAAAKKQADDKAAAAAKKLADDKAAAEAKKLADEKAAAEAKLLADEEALEAATAPDKK